MEEEKADQLYRLFKRTDEGARVKQGLGFSSASSAGWPGAKAPDTRSGAAGLGSMFVKAGTAPKAAGQPAAPPVSSGYNPAAAARVAARMAELKKEKVGDSRQHSQKARHSRSRSRSRGRDGSRPRRPSPVYDQDDRHTGRQYDDHRNGRSAGGADAHRRSRHYDRDDHHDERRGEDRYEGRRRSRERSRGRSRSRSRGRSRSRSRGRSHSRDRHRRHADSSRDRHRRSGYRDGDDDRGRERRDHTDSRGRIDRRHPARGGGGGGGGAYASSQGRDRAAAPDWDTLVPGYSSMNPAAQLKARTAYAIQEAEHSIQRRERDEARGEAAGGAAEARPWTRFVFNSLAPLEEEGGRPRTVNPEADDDDNAALQLEAVQAAARALGVEADTEQLNTVTFKVSAKTAATKQRDQDHAAAIFGAAPVAPGGGDGGGGDGRGAEAARSARPPVATSQRHLQAAEEPTAQHRVKQAGGSLSQTELQKVLAGTCDWSSLVSEDGPVLVLEDALPDPGTAGATGGAMFQQQQPDTGAAANRAVSHSRDVLLSAEVRGQQQLSWRERAAQAKARKSQVEEAAQAVVVEEPPAAPEPKVLPFTWRDKAKARKATLTGP